MAIQTALLVILVILPGRDDWPTPAWVHTLSTVLVVTGLVLVAATSLRLGRGLTPNPAPNGRANLVTGGPYRWVRHPIYSGVLVITVGLVLGSGSVVVLAVGLVTVAFFNHKAAWEEALLADRFPDYDAYRRRTPRFIPRPTRSGR